MASIWDPGMRDHLVARVGHRRRDARPEHPAFGHLSIRAWGVLIHRHSHHHLDQFGA